MNARFDLLHGTGEGLEMSLDIYNPPHGLSAGHGGEGKKTAVRIVQPAPDDTPSERKHVETMVLMTKGEARAIASALMGAASEL